MEELFTGSKPFLVSTRNCRRLSENVISLLSSISMAQSSIDTGLGNDSSISGASIVPLTPVPPSVAPTVVPTSSLMPSPFSPGWAANTLMVNEDYRWGQQCGQQVIGMPCLHTWPVFLCQTSFSIISNEFSSYFLETSWEINRKKAFSFLSFYKNVLVLNNTKNIVLLKMMSVVSLTLMKITWF